MFWNSVLSLPPTRENKHVRATTSTANCNWIMYTCKGRKAWQIKPWDTCPKSPYSQDWNKKISCVTQYSFFFFLIYKFTSDFGINVGQKNGEFNDGYIFLSFPWHLFTGNYFLKVCNQHTHPLKKKNNGYKRWFILTKILFCLNKTSLAILTSCMTVSVIFRQGYIISIRSKCSNVWEY